LIVDGGRAEAARLPPVAHYGEQDRGRAAVTDVENIALIRQFIEVCVRADPDEFASYFCDDAMWWNAPWTPVQGRAAIREMLRIGAARMTALPWEIRHIVADGDVVMTERVDHFRVGEKRIRVPCMGIFELRNGRIAAWRDYWDLKAFEAQLRGEGRAGD
jgi:limonene-1,2-epoxide hydrolase